MLLIFVSVVIGAFLIAADRWRHYREACIDMQAQAHKARQLTLEVIEELDAALEEFEAHRTWGGMPAPMARIRRLYIAMDHARGCSAALSRCNIHGRNGGYGRAEAGQD